MKYIYITVCLRMFLFIIYYSLQNNFHACVKKVNVNVLEGNKHRHLKLWECSVVIMVFLFLAV
jgi:hypothetical protein